MLTVAEAHEIRPGVLVMCLGNTPNRAHRRFAGTVHTAKESKVLTHADGQRTYVVWTLNPPTVLKEAELELWWGHDHLKVLRNPGDDERDESAAYLPPVPKRVPG